MNVSRIPDYDRTNPDGMLYWFSEMSVRDLLFHPDDAPDGIIKIATGEPAFNKEECGKLESILESMFTEHGDAVYESCYPVFMQKSGVNLCLDC